MRWRFAFAIAVVATIGGMLLYARHRRLATARERVKARLTVEMRRRSLWRIETRLHRRARPNRIRAKLEASGRIWEPAETPARVARAGERP